MAVGDVYVSDGIEFEVVWDGGEGLAADRVSKPGSFWEAPKRLYNKKSEYWTKRKSGVDKVAEAARESGQVEAAQQDRENVEPTIINVIEESLE